MNNRLRYFLTNFAVLACLSPLLKAQEADPAWIKQVGARAFPSSAKLFKANSYGAVGDGITLATHSIQAAIDDCGKKGGGVVVLDPGAYLSGSLFLKENVELRIDKGVEIKGSQRFEDYPEIDNRIAGIEMKWPAALLNIIGVKKAAITSRWPSTSRPPTRIPARLADLHVRDPRLQPAHADLGDCGRRDGERHAKRLRIAERPCL